MGSDVAEAQIDDLSDAEIDVLLEIYEVLRLTPDNGRKKRASAHEFGELPPRLTDRQLQIVGKVGHTARLLFACSAMEVFALWTTAGLSVLGGLSVSL
jgi:hypothetical protein